MFTTDGGARDRSSGRSRESGRALAGARRSAFEGYGPHHARELLAGVADEGERAQPERIVEALYRCYVESDATLCEINPLIVTPDGIVRALDAKVTIDDSALFRHPDLAELRDLSAADPLEAFARERGVIYVKLDGSVGILGNGSRPLDGHRRRGGRRGRPAGELHAISAAAALRPASSLPSR